jgi:hypothetical protein
MQGQTVVDTYRRIERDAQTLFRAHGYVEEQVEEPNEVSTVYNTMHVHGWRMVSST